MYFFQMNIWKEGTLIKCFNVMVTNSKETRNYKGKLFVFNKFIVFTELIQSKNQHIYQGYSKNENVTFTTKKVNGKICEVLYVKLGANFIITFYQLEEKKYDWTKILLQTTIRRERNDNFSPKLSIYSQKTDNE